MSSWKKASKVNQKVHRERHQPSGRDHLGLLEKKKDYKLRANDFHKKQKVLKVLKRKALDRNPDEFYYHMVNSKTVDGKHMEKKKITEDTVLQKKLMASRSRQYVDMKRTEENHKVNRLTSELHLTDVVGQVKRTHLKFDDEGKPASYTPDTNSLHKNEALLQSELPPTSTLRKIARTKEKRYEELAKRIERENQLKVVQRKMEIDKALRDRKVQKPKLVAPGTATQAPVFKWKYERKR